MNKPTVGRIVHFHPVTPVGAKPAIHAAIICFVHTDSLVNLSVFDALGHTYARTSVCLIEDYAPPIAPNKGDAVAEVSTWPPKENNQSVGDVLWSLRELESACITAGMLPQAGETIRSAIKLIVAQKGA